MARTLISALCVTMLAGACSITEATPASTTALATDAPVALTLEPEGLGDVTFGTTPEDLIVALTPTIGAPDDDTGWFDGSAGIYGACPPEVRVITWGSLAIFFTMNAGFFAYSYGFDFEGADAGTDARTLELETPSGVGLGTTVGELRSLEPSAVIDGDASIDVWSFSLGSGPSPHLRGSVTSADDAGRVVIIETSDGCS